jgi:alpha-amylase/alpha-mannosidase (GH57 family)
MKEFFQAWPSAAVQREFELLRDIANLFIVDEAQWKSVIEASTLSRLSRNDILLLVQRRTDWKSAFAKKYI